MGSKYKPLSEEQATALRNALIPTSDKEVVIFSAKEVIFGICMRIGKRTYERTTQHDVLRHIHGIRWLWKCATLRVKSLAHRKGLKKIGLDYPGEVIFLNPTEYEGIAHSQKHFKAWKRYGEKWPEGMAREQREAYERSQRLQEILRDLERMGSKEERKQAASEFVDEVFGG